MASALKLAGAKITENDKRIIIFVCRSIHVVVHSGFVKMQYTVYKYILVICYRIPSKRIPGTVLRNSPKPRQL